MSTKHHTPEPADKSFTALYNYHVHEAVKYEEKARTEMDRMRTWLGRRNPRASQEWLDKEVSNSHYVKSHISNQQFHTREATKYGLGMLMEQLRNTLPEGKK